MPDEAYSCASCGQVFLKADCSAQKFANHRKNCKRTVIDDDPASDRGTVAADVTDRDPLHLTDRPPVKDETAEHASSASSSLLAMLDSAREVLLFVTCSSSAEQSDRASACARYPAGCCSWVGMPAAMVPREPSLRNRRPRERNHPSRPTSPTALQCTHARPANR